MKPCSRGRRGRWPAAGVARAESPGARRLAREHRNRRRRRPGFPRVSRERARWRAAFLPAGGEGRALPGPRAQHHRRAARASSSPSTAATSSTAANRSWRVPSPCTCSTPGRHAGLRRLARQPRRHQRVLFHRLERLVRRGLRRPFRARRHRASRCTARCRRRGRCTSRTTNASAAPMRASAPRRERAVAREKSAARAASESAGTGYGDRRVDHAVRGGIRRAFETPTAAISSSTSGARHCAASISSSAARRIASGMNPRWASRRRRRAGADTLQQGRR